MYIPLVQLVIYSIIFNYDNLSSIYHSEEITMSTIHVNYESAATVFKATIFLDKLKSYQLLSFDVETQALYSQSEIKQAKSIVNKGTSNYSRNESKLLKQIARASGLSNPDIVKVTHFIFGISEDFSYIIIANSPYEELRVWNWLAKFPGKLLVHNCLYDLKIMYNRIGKLPQDYEDTQLMAKTLINDADDFQSRVGLKVLMQPYYDPKWTMLDDEGYNITDYKKESFLRYSAIDGAATFKLYQLLLEQVNQQKE